MYGKSEVDATKLLRDTPWVPYFNKIYVDEVQDYTQAEIAVFLLAVGFKTDALFLAGDPAQSVVEGVDFRFEEVRTLVYKLTAGRESVQRPIKLITNYRSHNGVLACAAAIIEKLLLMFPGSANVLSKDEGLFTGPRPNYCVARDPVEMLRVIGKDVAVLAPDSSPWLKRAAAGTDSDPTPSAAPSNEMEGGGVIGGAVDGEEDTEEVEEGAGTTFSPAPHKGTTSTTTVSTTGGGNSSSGGDGGGILHLGNTVMGIRAAKGLEFSDVMILDFFRHIPEHDHRAWKVLFSDSTQTADVAVRDKQFEYPQLEPQLKMLYTAITRSMNRLVFVESDVTPAGDAFFRWLERHQLAEKYDLATARKRGEERFITADEWKVRGIQFAGQVDSATTGGAEAAEGLLDNAIQCFTNAGDTVLKNAAALQKRLVLCKLKVLNMGTSAAGADRIGGAKDSAEALETEVHKAIVAGVEGGLFEDTRDLCELWAEQLQPEYLKPVFRAQVYDLLGKLCDF